jgi:hypothetical protein
MNVHDTKLPFEPDVRTAVEFLEKLRPGGPWVLTAILPDKVASEPPTVTITAHNAEQVDKFVRTHNGVRNIYYSVNPTRHETNSKAARVRRNGSLPKQAIAEPIPATR